MQQKKARRWGIILWTDNPTHINALDYIKRNYQNYIYILHNLDVKEDNTLKKLKKLKNCYDVAKQFL